MTGCHFGTVSNQAEVRVTCPNFSNWWSGPGGSVSRCLPSFNNVLVSVALESRQTNSKNLLDLFQTYLQLHWKMTRPIDQPAQQGPSSSLISCIEHLGNLLKNLPDTLPLDPPESRYNFGVDTDHVTKEGMWYAFNKALKVCFETHKLAPNATIMFQERGHHYKMLIRMFKDAVKALPTDNDQNFLCEVWLE